MSVPRAVATGSRDQQREKENQDPKQTILVVIAAGSNRDIILLSAFDSTSAQAEKPKGSLAADIIGTWKGKREDDAITLTFNKDKSFSLKESESAPTITDQYEISGPDTVELKAPNHLGMKVKIKVVGDMMQITDDSKHSLPKGGRRRHLRC